MRYDSWEDVFIDYQHQYDCPYLEISEIGGLCIRSIVEINPLTAIIENFINNDFYVYICINMKYIEAYHYPDNLSHNAFIYGFDSQKELFYIADFFGFPRKFATKTCSYQEMERAFACYDATFSEMDNANEHDPMIVYKLIKDTVWDFKPELLKRDLTDYLEGRNLFRSTSIKTQDEYYFGINIYKQLLKLFRQNGMIDSVRPLHLLYDRARLMEKRIDFMLSNHYIPFDENIRKSAKEYTLYTEMLRNRYIKDQIISRKNNMGQYNGTMKLIEIVEEKDIAFTKELLSLLES
jgi:hypothetical protein